MTLTSQAENWAPRDYGLKLDGVKKDDGGGLNTWQRYGQSKLANILYTRASAKHEAALSEGKKDNEVKHMVVEPGAVNTNLGEFGSR